MDTFVVYLPRYGYSQSFDYTTFIEKFPDSVITRALDLTHEKTIPLENVSVTPDILNILSQILTTQYPYVPPEYKKAMDYLGIDLPDPVYNPKYQEVLAKYHNFDLDALEGKNYSTLLDIAKETEFPELAQYVFSHTSPSDHSDEDYKFFQSLIESYSAYLRSFPPAYDQMGVMLLKNRNIFPLIQNEVLVYGRPPSLQHILDNRVANMLGAYVELQPGAIETYSLMDDILTGIKLQPEFYLEYIAMLLKIAPYISGSGFQSLLYGITTASYNGNLGEVKGYLGELGNLVDDFSSALTATALYRKHYDISQLIIDRELSYINGMFGESENEYDMEQLKEGISRFLADLSGIYTSHPEWVTPEGIQLVTSYFKYLTPEEQVSYKNYMRRRLQERGHGDLANYVI